jgi:hypothetical protein
MSAPEELPDASGPNGRPEAAQQHRLTMQKEDADLIVSTIKHAETNISAHRSQRWDVVKWALTANLGLATLSATLHWSLAITMSVSSIVAFVGLVFVSLYSLQIYKTNRDLRQMEEYFSREFALIFKKTSRFRVRLTTFEWLESTLMFLVVILSLAPVLVAFATDPNSATINFNFGH